jgi:phospholipase/carboxylesterase
MNAERAPEEWRIPQESASWCDIFLPEKRDAPLLVALHGYGGSKSSMGRLVRPSVPDGFALACLQGPHPHLIRPEDRSKPLGVGFGWISNWKPEESIAMHHAAIEAVVSRLAAEGRIDPGAVFLLGFSQSVALNFRYAFTYPGKVRGVIAVAGGIPGDWKDSPRYRDSPVDVLYLAGRSDEFYPPEKIEENARALESRGARVAVRVLETGHDFPAEAMPIVRTWLEERTAGRLHGSPSPAGEGARG